MANTSVCPANTGFIAAGHQRATKLTSVFLSSSSFCICQLCGSLMAGGNKSHVCQGKQKCLLSKLGICTAKFDVCITPLCRKDKGGYANIKFQCAMFNVQCLMFIVQYSNIQCSMEMREMCTVSKMVLF